MPSPRASPGPQPSVIRAAVSLTMHIMSNDTDKEKAPSIKAKGCQSIICNCAFESRLCIPCIPWALADGSHRKPAPHLHTLMYVSG